MMGHETVRLAYFQGKIAFADDRYELTSLLDFFRDEYDEKNIKIAGNRKAHLSREGETFGWEGLAPNARYATDARADEESETLHLSSARFREFVREQPQHALSLIGQMVDERTVLLEKLRELATLSVEQRLISSLVRLAQARLFTTDDGRIALGAPQYKLLCELVGATRESVSLVLTRLVAEGLAERNGTTIYVSSVSALTERLESNRSDGETPLIVMSEFAVEARD